MTLRPLLIGSLVVPAVLSAGCKSASKKPDARDPLTMSHLTHGKNDPLYAGTDSDMLDDDRGTIKAASVSRKPELTRDRQPVRTISFQDDPSRVRASDYSWIVGKLTRHSGKDGGWYIRYANAYDGDRFGGELRFANMPRLGLLRDGDNVQVEGAVIDSGFDRPAYRVDSIVLRD